MDPNMEALMRQSLECFKPLEPRIISPSLLVKSRIRKECSLVLDIEFTKTTIHEPKFVKKLPLKYLKSAEKSL